MADNTDLEEIRATLDEQDLAAGSNSAGSSSPAGGSALAGFRSRVDYELRAALGRLPKPGAAREFIADLDAAFQVRAVGGRDQFTWKPRLNVGVGNFGGTTPIVQSIISRRAQSMGGQVLPILEQLQPLDEDADPESLAARRNETENALSQLIAELNRDGEIRDSRVEQLFETLGLKPGKDAKDRYQLVPIKPFADPLFDLGNRFGFITFVEAKDNPTVPDDERLKIKNQNIITLDEEQQLANFFIVRDSVAALGNMWSAFYKGRGGFFSTQLFFLSRNLSVAEQAVDDAYQVLDSVYFGSAKRQVEAITPALAGPQFQKISLEDFLSWTKVFVASEAPEMIQETGKVGARSVFITLTTLHAIAAAAQTTIANERFQHKRVTRVWKELVANLLRARDDAKTAAQTLEP